MPKFNSYDNITQPDVAAGDELAIWDTSLSLLKNITADEIRKYILNNPSVIGNLTVAGLLTVAGGPLVLDNNASVLIKDSTGSNVTAVKINSTDDLILGSSVDIDNLFANSSLDQVYSRGGAEKFRVTSTGAKTTGIHEVTEGIKFPAIAVPSADPNTIDDYEKGSWSPTLLDDTLDTGEGQTYAAGNKGFYTKIGDVYHITGRLNMSSLGTLNTAQTANVGGLPAVAANNGTFPPVNIGYASSLALSAAGDIPTGRIIVNKSSAVLYEWDLTTGVSGLPISKITASGLLDFGATYRV